MRARLLSIVLAIAATTAACGGDVVPSGRAGECAKCHLADGHHGRKPAACAVCHTQDAWRPTVLHHRWALEGKHEKLKCAKCHPGASPKFEGIAHDCVDCHRDDYERAKHHEDKPETCDDCHTPSSWKVDKKKKGGKAKPPADD